MQSEVQKGGRGQREVQRCRAAELQSCRAAVAEVQNRFRGAGAGSEDIWFRTGSEVHRCILGA